MPEQKPNARDALIKAGMIKPGNTPPPAATPDPATPPSGDSPPPATAEPVALPKFDSLVAPAPVAHAPDPDGLPPESSDASLSQNEQKARRMMRDHIKRLEVQLKAKGNGEEATKELQTKLDQAYDKIAELDLTHDPRFQAAYEIPKKQILEDMAGVLEQFGAERSVADKLVGKTIPEMVAILKDEAPDCMGAMSGLMRDLAKNEQDRLARITNRSKSKEDMIRWQTQQDAQRMEQSFDVVFTEAANAGNPLFREVPGNDAFNANVSALKKYAKQLAGDRSELGIARLCQKAAGGEVAYDLYLASERKNRAMESQLAAMGAALPRTGGGGGGGEPPPQTRKPRSAEDVAREVAARHA